LNPK
jgi:hypothetical protein